MNENRELVLSKLGHTWILDLDGTIVKHNGYRSDGKDTFLDGALHFLKNIPQKDMVIFITSRSEELREDTMFFLNKNGVRFDHLICNAPHGERILVNDDKPSGLKTGYVVNTKRDEWCGMSIREDDR